MDLLEATGRTAAQCRDEWKMIVHVAVEAFTAQHDF